MNRMKWRKHINQKLVVTSTLESFLSVCFISYQESYYSLCIDRIQVDSLPFFHLLLEGIQGDFDEFTSGFSLLHYHCDHNAHHFMGIVSSSFASVLPNFGNQPRFVHGIDLICIEHRDGKFFVKDMYRFWTRTLQVVLLTVLGFYIPIFSSINAINILKHMNEWMSKWTK